MWDVRLHRNNQLVTPCVVIILDGDHEVAQGAGDTFKEAFNRAVDNVKQKVSDLEFVGSDF